MEGSAQKALSRIRPPRVQITYDVETGGAIEKKELPLVVGILADLAGKQEKPLPPIKARKFVEIDRDNFNEVMKSIGPRLDFTVPNRLQKEGGNLKAELRFENIADLRPEAVVKKLEPLRKLFEARQRLNDLIAKLDGNDDLDQLLRKVVDSSDEQQKIKASLNGGSNG